MKSKSKGLRRLETFFFQIAQIKSVSKEGQSAETAVYRWKIINLITSCFYPVPLKRNTAEREKSDLFKEKAKPFFGAGIRAGNSRLLNHIRLSRLFKKGKKKMCIRDRSKGGSDSSGNRPGSCWGYGKNTA